MKLYLMRHGEAKSNAQNIEPELTESGKTQVKKIANNLSIKDVSFTQVYHSKKKRAHQTAEIMIDILTPGLTARVHNKISPNDDPEIIFKEMSNWNEDTLITSHLPFVPDLITLLTGRDAYTFSISFEPATLVCLEKNNNSNWDLKWSIAPSEINNN